MEGSDTMKAKRVWHQRPSTRSTRAKRTRLLMLRGPFCGICGRLILRGQVTLDHRQPIHYGGDNSDDKSRPRARRLQQRQGLRVAATTPLLLPGGAIPDLNHLAAGEESP